MGVAAATVPACSLLYATMRAGTLRMCLAAQYSSVPFSPLTKKTSGPMGDDWGSVWPEICLRLDTPCSPAPFLAYVLRLGITLASTSRTITSKA